MSRSKPNNKVQQKAVTNNLEFLAIPTQPKRDGLAMKEFTAAVKQAEATTNPSYIKLQDMYINILTDLHLTGVVKKRRYNIASTKYEFVSENGKFNEAIDNLMNMPWWRQMLTQLLDATLFGYTVSWLDLSGGTFQKYKMLPRKHILPNSCMFLSKQTDRTGIVYSEPPYSNFIVSAGESGDLGDLLKAVPWVLLKRGDISDWATFNEFYAAPFRKGKYPQYDIEAKKALGKACAEAASFGFAIIPDTTDLEFIQTQASSSTDAYERFAAFCDKQISKGFLLNTMTLDAEGGKYKGDIHNESEKGVFAADRQYVLDILNTQILALLEIHGFNPGKGYFVVTEEDHLCLKDRIIIDEKVDSKVEIPAHYWYARYGIPMPEGGPKARVASPTPTSKMSEQFNDLQSEFLKLRQSYDEFVDNLPIQGVERKKRGFFD